MPRQLSILLLALGAIGIGLLCVLLVRGETPQRVGLAHVTDTELQKGDHVQTTGADLANRAGDTDASTRRGPPSSGATAEETGSSCATFSYSNGTPAIGLGVCSATSPNVFNIEVAAGPAVWAEHLDDQGRLSDEVARRLGPLVDVRLSSCSLQLMRLDPLPGQHYGLPDVIPQAFRLPGAPPGVNVKFLVEARDLTRCAASVAYREETTDTGFADRFRVTAVDSLHDTLVLACARAELSSDKASMSVLLPAGWYAITPLTCSIGWWFDDFLAEAKGVSIDIPLHQVAVTTVMLPPELNGRTRQPTDTRVVVASHDPRFAESSGEIRLPWKVDGDRILVSQTYRDAGDERYVTYALKIYWSDGTDSTTQLGTWESLLGTVTFEK